MRALRLSTLLLAGLLLVHVCSAAADPAAASNAKAKTAAKPRHHQHMPRMDVQQQKEQSIQQERNQNRASTQQVAPVGPLHPDCVPKYVTDLVVPPPMPIMAPPVGTQDAHEQGNGGRRHLLSNNKAEASARITSVDKKKKKVQIEEATEDWQFTSNLRESEQGLEPVRAAKPRKPSKRAGEPSISDDFYESIGFEVKPKKQPDQDDSIGGGSLKNDYPSLDEEMQDHETWQRWNPGYLKKPKYPKRGYYPTPPGTPQQPPMQPPNTPTPQPPTNPTPQPPTTPTPPPVANPPVTPPPVTPPPINPPPLVPPPVVPPPVGPPPVVPPPVVPPPIVPPPVVPPPVVPPPTASDNYDISVRQIRQDVLPPAPNALPTCPVAFNPTTVLAYGPRNIVGQPFHNWPGFTIEAQRNIATRITWTNDLKDAQGNFLPHILRDSIDQTIPWANPAAIGGSIDSNPCQKCSKPGLTCRTDQACITAARTTYTGPVPIVTHVHGQSGVFDWANGYTEAWYMPAAVNLAGFFDAGTWYSLLQQQYTAVTGQTWAPGTNTGIYRNTQRPTALWYHDHTLGLTRTNVYAGMAGFYLIRERFPSLANGPELPGIPYPAYDGIIPIGQVRELPLAIQDRSFTTDSQLWYPVADNPPADVLPNGRLHPRWIPEYSATVIDPVTGLPVNMLMMTVNGRTYPRHTVYPDAYRLRILNGCNSRTMQLRFARSDLAALDPLSPTAAVNLVPFYVIGNEGGWFPELQPAVTTLQIGPGERYDVIIDFSGLLPGQFVYLLNNGPETDTSIYDGANNGVGLTPHTAQIMRFDVSGPVAGVQPAQPFDLAQQEALDAALRAHWAANVAPVVPNPTLNRDVALVEELNPAGLPITTLLGSVGANGLARPNLWVDRVTTNVPLGAGQCWDIIYLSGDSQPIHLHNVDFEYLGRFALTLDPANPLRFTKTTTPVPNPDLDQWLDMPCLSSATGRCAVPKDTIVVLPNSYTRIGFSTPLENGLYMWDCHLAEREDNEMKLPFCFGQPNYPDPRRPGALMCPGPN